jgi:hypothetical protein
MPASDTLCCIFAMMVALEGFMGGVFQSLFFSPPGQQKPERP